MSVREGVKVADRRRKRNDFPIWRRNNLDEKGQGERNKRNKRVKKLDL